MFTVQFVFGILYKIALINVAIRGFGKSFGFRRFVSLWSFDYLEISNRATSFKKFCKFFLL
jgi:hypothetical protein